MTMFTGYQTPLHYSKSNLQVQSPPSSGTSSGLSRLLAAAVINRGFCQLLLEEPARALEAGFQGEAFALSEEELDRVLSIQAEDLGQFARLLSSCQTGSLREEPGEYLALEEPALLAA
jgi:hypothetical protein